MMVDDVHDMGSALFPDGEIVQLAETEHGFDRDWDLRLFVVHKACLDVLGVLSGGSISTKAQVVALCRVLQPATSAVAFWKSRRIEELWLRRQKDEEGEEDMAYESLQIRFEDLPTELKLRVLDCLGSNALFQLLVAMDDGFKLAEFFFSTHPALLVEKAASVSIGDYITDMLSVHKADDWLRLDEKWDVVRLLTSTIASIPSRALKAIGNSHQTHGMSLWRSATSPMTALHVFLITIRNVKYIRGIRVFGKVDELVSIGMCCFDSCTSVECHDVDGASPRYLRYASDQFGIRSIRFDAGKWLPNPPDDFWSCFSDRGTSDKIAFHFDVCAAFS